MTTVKVLTVKAIVSGRIVYRLVDERQNLDFAPHVATEALKGGDGEPLGTITTISRSVVAPAAWRLCTDAERRARKTGPRWVTPVPEQWMFAEDGEVLASTLWEIACAQERRLLEASSGWRLSGDERAAWVDGA